MADNMKLEKLYDNDGEVKGYKLGDYYLMKHYCSITNNSLYTWIINKDGSNFYFNSEFDEAYNNGDIIIVENCKLGKQKLRELANK